MPPTDPGDGAPRFPPGPRTLSGGRALLFDRLAQAEPEGPDDPRGRRVLDPAQLRESVRREVTRLLNTRATRPPRPGAERTVVDYGVRDLSGLYTRDAEAHAAVEAELERAVAAFEPRLRSVRVKALPRPTDRSELRLSVEAMLVVGEVVEPVSFPVLVTGSVEE